MKYNIYINQVAAVMLSPSLDIIDMAIVDYMSSFANSSSCIKVNTSSGVYFWISHKKIIDDMPLLGITTTRGIAKRIEKLIALDILKKHEDCETYQKTLYAFGESYDKLVFTPERNDIPLNASSTPPMNESSGDNNIIIDYNIKEEKDKSFSKKVSKDALFEDCWKQYRRKGAKAKAKAQWDKMTQEEKEMILPHIKAYVSSRELQFQKDFERYLKDKTYSTLVIANNQVIYDPTLGNSSEYSPTLSWQLFYNEDIKCHLYIGHFNGFISDGYEDSKRPNGATVMLNNGRGKIVWDSNSQKWMLVK